MAKKTKEELAQARRRRETERIAREKQERLEHENKLKDYKERVNKFLASVDKLGIIKSDLDGQYDEFEKLNKKSPADQITVLQFNIVNDLIQDITSEIKNDEYVQKVKPFVEAGDRPEYRDVVGILRRLKEGLIRHEVTINKMEENLKREGRDLTNKSIKNLRNLDEVADFDEEIMALAINQ